MSFEDAAVMMVSFRSTLKPNLSVGLPLDLLVSNATGSNRCTRADRAVTLLRGDLLELERRAARAFTPAGLHVRDEAAK
jgi:hypothetical protein